MDFDCGADAFLEMDVSRIASYASHALSDDAPYFGKVRGVKTPEAERLAICLNDPKFGWNFVNSLTHSRQPLPKYVTEHSLRNAYAYLTTGKHCPFLAETIALTHPNNTGQRNVLKALLLCPDILLHDIYDRMGIKILLVHLFSDLFFNVRKRLNERGYIANLLYPKSRFDTYRADSMENEDPGLLMMRAGYEYGANEVFRLAGLDRKGDTKVPTAELHDEFEYSVMQNGVTLARHGYLNSKGNLGIAHAKALLAAKRKATENSPAINDNAMGLPALSMGQGIMEVVKGLQAPDIEERRKLQMRHMELEARRAETAKAEKNL